MSDMLDAYFWCQLLGWNFDIGSIILLDIIGIAIVFGIIFLIFILSVIFD